MKDVNGAATLPHGHVQFDLHQAFRGVAIRDARRGCIETHHATGHDFVLNIQNSLPSTIQEPYSGRQADKIAGRVAGSESCFSSTSMASCAISAIFTSFVAGSKCMRWYSISSPHNNASFSRSLTAENTSKNCVMPWSRTAPDFPQNRDRKQQFSYISKNSIPYCRNSNASSHFSGVPASRKPIRLS